MSELICIVMGLSSPWITELLYRWAVAEYRARLRRSVVITADNAWLGLLVETWDGLPPRRWVYTVVGQVARWLWFLCGIVWWLQTT